jgi:hypothetical protein
LTRFDRAYVAEAGRGGTGSCVTSPEGDSACFGQTGAITRVFYGHQRRVLSGLPSVAPEGGAGASGPQDVDVDRYGFGSFITGLGADPAERANLDEAASDLASIFAFTPFGRVSKRADLGAYETAAESRPGPAGRRGRPVPRTSTASSPARRRRSMPRG